MYEKVRLKIVIHVLTRKLQSCTTTVVQYDILYIK